MSRTWCILLLACAAVLMAIPASAASLNFDFNADNIYDTSWELDPPPPGGSTATVRVWLDGWTNPAPPTPPDKLFGFGFYFNFNPATIRVNSVTINDQTLGGPFDPAYNFVDDQGGGIYVVSGAIFSCYAIVDKVLLATIQIECIAAGDSTIAAQTNAALENSVVRANSTCTTVVYEDATSASANIQQSECATDPECWNNSWCDGTETCVDGLCQPGTPPCADDGDNCTDTCLEGSPPAELNPGTCNVCNATNISDPCCQESFCAAEPVCTVAFSNYYVDATNGSNANDGLSPATAWKTITYALSQVSGTQNNQVIVNVASGIYDTVMGGGDAESFPLLMEEYVSLKGQDYKTTIIDAQQTSCVIQCVLTNNLTIEGFTITGGSFHKGGGLYLSYSSPTVKNCLITGNVAVYENGGGIYCQSASPLITNCIIAGNIAGQNGGGIACGRQSSPIITNCTIVGNRAEDQYSYGEGGGALFCGFESSPPVTNCILWDNEPNEVFVRAGQGAVPVLNYCDVQGGYPGTGNIDANPRFLAPDDFNLTFGSPCIDAANSIGAPLTDIDGNARFNDFTTPDTGAGPITYYDIGAYEFTGDSDKDGVLDDGDQSGVAGDNPCLNGAVVNCDDNCLSIPNGPDLGTCLAGSVGATCLSDTDCGAGGTCSLQQEDFDADGVGTVCDNCRKTANGPLKGTCAQLASGLAIPTSRTCTSDDDCTDYEICILDQDDTNSNGAGDACECYADADDDCKVQLSDLVIHKSEFGRMDCAVNPPPCRADANSDGKVNLADLVILKIEFGRFNCEPCSN